MAKEAVFTMKLEPSLRDEFMAEAAADHRPASQVVRELMRDYIERRRQARAYDEFLQRKVDAARAERDAGHSYSQEEIEAEFSALRDALLKRDDA